MVAALSQSRGLLTVAARILGCSRPTVYKYIRDYPECQAAYEDAQEAMGDVAESALFRAVSDRDPWAVQFYLKTKQRNRGYGDRSELDVTTTIQGQVKVDIDGFIAAIRAARVGDARSDDAVVNPESVLSDT